MTGNVLAIYRKLPRTNCGACRAGTCMAFALSLAQGDGTVPECPLADADGVREIQSLLVDVGDWREELADKFLKELPCRRASGYPGTLGVEDSSQGELRVMYLGRPILIGTDGFTDLRSPWDRIIILRYLLQRGTEPLRNKWVSFRELRDGRVKAAAFTKECERPLAGILHEHPEAAASCIESFGGIRILDTPAPSGWDIRPFSGIPFRIQFWPGEEEYTPDCKILLDASATSYLDVESLIFLGERLVKHLADCIMGNPPGG